MSDQMLENQPIDAVPAEQVQAVETEAAAPETAAAETLTPLVLAGAQLAALREERGWSTEQIANQLNLANRQIQALEADNYAALPGMVIVRGFIRSYAKVLKVDPAPILAAIVDGPAAPSVLPPERSPLSASFSEAKLSASTSRRFSFKVMVGVAVLAALGLLIFGGQRMGWIPVTPASGPSGIEEKLTLAEPAEIQSAAVIETVEARPETVETSLPMKDLSLPVSAAKPPAAAAVPVLESKPSASVAPVIAAQPLAVAQPAPAPVAVPAGKVVAAAAPVDSKNALAIKARQDSWVEIRRADDTVLFSRLLKAGSAEVIGINEPVSIVIGNAAGVDMTLRGAPVDVVAGNTSNVARLNLK